MAITIYPTTGYDSFCSVADADTLIPLYFEDVTAWTAKTEAQKEILLRNSTVMVNGEVDSDCLPSTLEDNLKLACAYLANFIIGKDVTQTSDKAYVKSKEIVDVVKTEYFSGRQSDDTLPSFVTKLLSDYCVVSSNTFEFNRA